MAKPKKTSAKTTGVRTRSAKAGSPPVEVRGSAQVRRRQKTAHVALSKGTEELRTSRQELLLVAAALSILLEDSGLKDRQGAERPASS